MRRVVSVVAIALVGGGCASILGIDKDYEDVGAADASNSEVGDGTTSTGDASEDSRTTDGGLDAPFDGTPYVPLANGDLRVHYAKVNGDVAFRTWSIASKTWSDPTVIAQYPDAAVTWLRPTLRGGAEALGLLAFAGGGAGGAFTMMGTEPGWMADFTVPNVVPVTRAAHRGFDLAFTSASGDRIAVYADGTPNPKFRRRVAGGVWSAEQPVLANVPGIAAVDWVELVAHPTTNEVTLLYTDVARRLRGVVWNGTAWDASATPLDATTLNPSDHQSFTGVYEQLSGALLVIWSRASTCGGPVDPLYFATKPGGSSTFTMSSVPMVVGGFGPIAAAAERGTNNIAFIAIEQTDCCVGCNDLAAGHWDGTQWTSIVDHDGTTNYTFNERPGTRPVAAGWLGGAGVGVYSKPPSGNINGEVWEPGIGWGTSVQPVIPLTPATAVQATLQLIEIPTVTGILTNNMVLLITDVNGNVWTKLVDGDGVVDMNGGSPLAVGVRANGGVAMGMVTR